MQLTVVTKCHKVPYSAGNVIHVPHGIEEATLNPGCVEPYSLCNDDRSLILELFLELDFPGALCHEEDRGYSCVHV